MEWGEQTEIDYLLSLAKASANLAFEIEKMMLETKGTHLAGGLAEIVPLSLSIKNKLNLIWEEYINDYVRNYSKILGDEQ